MAAESEPRPHGSGNSKAIHVDNEKDDAAPASSNVSDDGSPLDIDRDMEKAAPVEAVSDQGHAPDPSDPNVVDWDSSDDPHNPMNWSVPSVIEQCCLTP